MRYIASAMQIVVIIATYNEAPNTESLVKKILDLPEKMDVLIVDDNSPDGTGEIAARLEGEDEVVHVIHRAEKMGLGSAFKDGVKWAIEHGYELICTMDADHSHAPEYLPQMLKEARYADLVIGSRYISGGGVQNWPRTRMLLSRTANFYARNMMGLDVKDCTSGYRIYSRNFLERVDMESVASSGFSFLEELLFEASRKGFKIREHPILFVDRVKGISKITPAEIFKGGWNLLKKRLKS